MMRGRHKPLTIIEIGSAPCPSSLGPAMHRDTKIGLAMAILIVGFAAALCFPNRPAPLPVTIRAGELDEQIQLLPVHAYTGLDKPQVVVAVAEHEPTPVVVDSGVRPAGIRLPMLETAEPTATTKSRAKAVTLTAPEETSSEPQEHVVRPGETLSALAAKYLGNRSHYDQIFEANRDQLTSPDALQVGMRLRIPR